MDIRDPIIRWHGLLRVSVGDDRGRGKNPLMMRPFGAAPLSLVAALLVVACASAGGDPDDGADLSQFLEGSQISGRVLENSTACEVDAVCYLRMQFSDTAIVAVYGTGERPPPPCDMTVGVSDVAFQVEPGEVVDVVISRCASEGHYLERIVR